MLGEDARVSEPGGRLGIRVLLMGVGRRGNIKVTKNSHVGYDDYYDDDDK